MECKCGFDNTDGAIFCAECGAVLNNIDENEIKKSFSEKNDNITLSQTSMPKSSSVSNTHKSSGSHSKGVTLGIVVALIIILVSVAAVYIVRTINGKNDDVLIEAKDEFNSNLDGDYSDSSETYSVGDVMTFGTYEQDNNLNDGKENIEWIVLEVQDSKALVVSKYGLDAVAYNTLYVGTTWENCTLRSWLNNNFYNVAFSDAEKNKIQTTTVYNTGNYEYKTDAGNTTEDRIFVLSIDEADRYFSNDELRTCRPTEYALQNGASKNSYDELIEIGDTPEEASRYAGNCWWWLRTPGSQADNAAYIFASGEIGSYGRNVNRDYVCVRPALWIEY